MFGISMEEVGFVSAVLLMGIGAFIIACLV